MASLQLLCSLLAVVVSLAIAEKWTGNLCFRPKLHYRKTYECRYRFKGRCYDWKTVYKSDYRFTASCCKGWTHYGDRNCIFPVCWQPCLNGGRCVAPDQCRCRPRYSGQQCEKETYKHADFPHFFHHFYNMDKSMPGSPDEPLNSLVKAKPWGVTAWLSAVFGVTVLPDSFGMAGTTSTDAESNAAVTTIGDIEDNTAGTTAGNTPTTTTTTPASDTDTAATGLDNTFGPSLSTTTDSATNTPTNGAGILGDVTTIGQGTTTTTPTTPIDGAGILGDVTTIGQGTTTTTPTTPTNGAGILGNVTTIGQGTTTTTPTTPTNGAGILGNVTTIGQGTTTTTPTTASMPRDGSTSTQRLSTISMPAYIGGVVSSAGNSGNATVFPDTLGNATVSPDTFGNASTSPVNDGNATNPPDTFGNATVSPDTFGNATVSPDTFGNASTSPVNDGNATDPPGNTNTPGNTGTSGSTVGVTPNSLSSTGVPSTPDGDSISVATATAPIGDLGNWTQSVV